LYFSGFSNICSPSAEREVVISFLSVVELLKIYYLFPNPFAYLPWYLTTHFGLSHQNKVGTMAAKVKENRALRNSLINQLREIREVAQSATEQPALRALLKRRFARAQSIFEKFEPLHSAIIAYVATQPESDLEAEEQIRIEFFEAFDEIDAAYVR
jgi:hypothetical protein